MTSSWFPLLERAKVVAFDENNSFGDSKYYLEFLRLFGFYKGIICQTLIRDPDERSAPKYFPFESIIIYWASLDPSIV